jgi:hypothetical protein
MERCLLWVARLTRSSMQHQRQRGTRRERKACNLQQARAAGACTLMHVLTCPAARWPRASTPPPPPTHTIHTATGQHARCVHTHTHTHDGRTRGGARDVWDGCSWATDWLDASDWGCMKGCSHEMTDCVLEACMHASIATRRHQQMASPRKAAAHTTRLGASTGDARLQMWRCCDSSPVAGMTHA